MTTKRDSRLLKTFVRGQKGDRFKMNGKKATSRSCGKSNTDWEDVYQERNGFKGKDKDVENE